MGRMFNASALFLRIFSLHGCQTANFLLKQLENLCDQISVGNGVVEPHRNRHHETPVFLSVSAPVHNRRKKQITVGQLNIKRIITQPGDI